MPGPQLHGYRNVAAQWDMRASSVRSVLQAIKEVPQAKVHTAPVSPAAVEVEAVTLKQVGDI